MNWLRLNKAQRIAVLALLFIANPDAFMSDPTLLGFSAEETPGISWVLAALIAAGFLTDLRMVADAKTRGAVAATHAATLTPEVLVSDETYIAEVRRRGMDPEEIAAAVVRERAREQRSRTRPS